MIIRLIMGPEKYLLNRRWANHRPEKIVERLPLGVAILYYAMMDCRIMIYIWNATPGGFLPKGLL